MKPTTVPGHRRYDRRFYGLAEGIVHAVDDPAREGRVKVSFPWFDGETITEWCRVLQFYAGGGYGAFFVPEVGDEVLVGFVHGDMRIPVILGGLYNGADKPATHRDADRDEKLIRTRAGHQILLEDTREREQVEVRSQGGHVLDMNDEEQKIVLTSAGGHRVELDDQGRKLTIRSASGHQIVMDDGGQSITVSTPAGQSIVMDQRSITCNAAEIKLGSAVATEAAVLGNLFMTLFNSHVHTSSPTGGPTSPPVTPMTPAVLSKTTKVQ